MNKIQNNNANISKQMDFEESCDSTENVSVERTSQEQLELDELNELYDRQERGEAIDEDRLYELELLDRYRQGETLSEEELGDVEFFLNQRALFARLKVELEDLVLKQNAGETIDADRLYLLELADRKRCGEALSSDEVEDLDVFLLYEGEKRETGDVLEQDIAQTDDFAGKTTSQYLEPQDLVARGKNVEGHDMSSDDRDASLFSLDRSPTETKDVALIAKRSDTASDAHLESNKIVEESCDSTENVSVERTSQEEPVSLEGNGSHNSALGLEHQLFDFGLPKENCLCQKDEQKADELSLFFPGSMDNKLKEGLPRDELFAESNSKALCNSMEKAKIGLLHLSSSQGMPVSDRPTGVEPHRSKAEHFVEGVAPTFTKLDVSVPMDLQCALMENKESVYIPLQMERLQRGEMPHRDEVFEPELLERLQRGDVLTKDEVEKFDMLPHERQEQRECHSIHEGGKNDSDLRSFVEPVEVVTQERQEKSKSTFDKEKVAPKPKVKRMRKKTKTKPTNGLDSTPEVRAPQETLPPKTMQIVHSVVAQPQPVSTQGSPTLFAAPPPARKGLFGGLFGKKSQRELELEEAKRRQEDLIKEQLRAMQLEEELLAMEREKTLQQMLVQEAIETKSKNDVSVSSWETDTSYEESMSSADELDATCDQPVSSHSDSSSSKSRLVDELSSHHNVVFAETFAPGETVGQSVTLDQSKEAEVAFQPRTITVIVPLSTETWNEDGTQQPTVIPDLITTTAHHLDAASMVSDESSVDIDEKSWTQRPDDTDADLQSPAAEGSMSRSPKSDQIKTSKAGSLAAHLRKQKQEQQKQDSRRQINRHGDEISLGTLGLRSRQSQLQMTDDNPSSPTSSHFERNSDESSKIVRPWRDAMTGRPLSYFSSRRAGSSIDDDLLNNKDFFEANTELFDRSIFNFNHSFAAKFGDGGAFEKADGLSVVAEDESDTSEPLQNMDNGASENNEDPVLLDSYASVAYDAEQSFSLLGYGEIESKLPGKRDKEEQFNEVWDTIEADKAIAAQMNQRRLMRLRERGNAREEKKDEGPAEIPRLFLFEGEKVKVKRKGHLRKKKDKKTLKKLDTTLTKEFRKAMRDVFDSESEEEYDRTFGEREGEEIGLKSPKSKSRFSNESPYDSDGLSSHSNNSDREMSEEEFNDDYLKRLREKSMQQEVKELLYDKKSVGGSATSDDESVASEVSRGRPTPVHIDSVASFGSVRKSASRIRRRRPRKNRSGDIVGCGIDPAEVYAQELQKKKTRKTFTVSELRKEMEEMRYGVTQASFDDAFGNMSSSKASLRTPKNPKTPLLKPKRFIPSKSPKPSGPGVNSLRALNENVRPTLGRETSFATHATGNSDQGLLGGRRKDYDTRKATFDIGGTLGNVPTIEEDDEEAFLTSHSPASKGTTVGNGRRSSAANFGLAISSFASNLISPGVRGPRPESSFGSGGHSGMSPHLMSSSKDDDGMSGIVFGGLGGTGFQDPLPLPTIQDEEHSVKKKRMASVARLVGKMKLSAKAFSLAGKKRQGSQDFGGMLDDDDEMEGGLLG